MSREDQALQRARELAEKKDEAERIQLAETVLQVASPLFDRLSTVIDTRLSEFTTALDSKQFEAQDVTLNTDDQPLKVESPELALLGSAIDHLRTQLSEGQVVIPDTITLADGQVIMVKGSVRIDDFGVLLDRMTVKLNELKSAKVTLKLFGNDEVSGQRYIPVRLTNGQEFYDAITAVYGGGGSSGPSLAKATDAYRFVAETITATHEYAFYEDAELNWYIERETLSTGFVDMAKGTGGVLSVYIDATTQPDIDEWGTFGEVF